MMKVRIAFVIVFLSLLVTLAGCGGGGTKNVAADKPQKTAETQQTQPSSQPQSQPEELPEADQPKLEGPDLFLNRLIPATVTRVVDGDTVHMSIRGRDETVRFIGVDTPETVHPTRGEEPYGRQASHYTKAQLDGKQVWLETDAQKRDKYGWLLAYVWLKGPREFVTVSDTVIPTDAEVRKNMLNARLLLEGYAQLMTIPPNVKYVDYFTNYQTEARNKNLGLWGLPAESAVDNAPQTPALVDVDTVYVTLTGHRYHRAGCRYLADGSVAMRLEQAKKAGYKPCAVCDPPE